MTDTLGNSAQWLAAVARGDVGIDEWLEISLQRILDTDGQVHAFTHQTFDRARQEATLLAARLRAGAPLPALAGMPYAVKNLYDIEGLTTLAGSRINARHPAATADAVLVQRLKAAGALLVGALNMDEYAYGFTTENAHFGTTRNPHGLERVAGGSSGGSAAAVAAGQVPVALGSDTNGSVRVPAALCGVWGLKPTFGRLSRTGIYPFVHQLDHAGLFADVVETLGRVYDALQGPDVNDPACRATRVQPVCAGLQHGLRGMRVATLSGYFEQFAHASSLGALQTAAAALGDGRRLPGIEWPDAAQARAAAFLMTAAEGSSLHVDDLRADPAGFDPGTVDRFLAGAMLPAHWVDRAHRFRCAYRSRINALFQDWDILLAPATPGVAPWIGHESMTLGGDTTPTRATLGLLTQPISLAGCPVVTAPMWPSDAEGMPVGVQIICAPWREDLALRAAWQLQAAGVAGVRPASGLTSSDRSHQKRVHLFAPK